VIDDQEIYSLVGGDGPFYELVERFYQRVQDEPDLRKLYPADLDPGKQHLAWFLIQRFGGPAHFNEKRGAPMLRRRHAPFAIDLNARDTWVRCMMDAVDAIPVFVPFRSDLATYFEDAATFLINRVDTRPGDRVLRQS
jgi:hemoglobin